MNVHYFVSSSIQIDTEGGWDSANITLPTFLSAFIVVFLRNQAALFSRHNSQVLDYAGEANSKWWLILDVFLKLY